MIKIKDLMTLEKNLLDIKNTDQKFNISLNDVMRVKKWLSEIGEITDTFFKLQVEYANKVKDNSDYLTLLKQYHDKLSDDDVDYDTSEIVKFLEKK